MSACTRIVNQWDLDVSLYNARDQVCSSSAHMFIHPFKKHSLNYQQVPGTEVGAGKSNKTQSLALKNLTYGGGGGSWNEIGL